MKAILALVINNKYFGCTWTVFAFLIIFFIWGFCSEGIFPVCFISSGLCMLTGKTIKIKSRLYQADGLCLTVDSSNGEFPA